MYMCICIHKYAHLYIYICVYPLMAMLIRIFSNPPNWGNWPKFSDKPVYHRNEDFN